MAPRTLLVALALTLALAATARAQEPGAGETALAREQYQDGMHFAQSGHWEQAYQAFSRAYQLVHRPALLANLASAEAQTSRLVEAGEHYRQFLREVTSGREAQQRPAVQTALDALDARIPRARFVLSDARPTDVYTLDGTALSSAVLGTPYPIDPGDHTLVVKAGDTELAHVAFTLHEGESRDVPIEVHRPLDTHIAASATLHDRGPGGEGEREGGAHPADTRDQVGPSEGRGPGPVEQHDDGGILDNPVFWVVVIGLVVAAASTGIYFATQGGREPFGGANLGTVTIP